MRACKRCRYGVPAIDKQPTGDVPFVICALLPPKLEVIEGKQVQLRPNMTPQGWCGQFRLSFMRLIWGHGAA